MPRAPLRPGRAGSLAYVAGVYTAAVAAAWASFAGLELHPLANAGVGLLAAMAVTYAASLHAENGSVFDPYWSVLPPFVALYLAGESGREGWGPRQVAVLVVVLLWALRLTANWARGWPGLHHEDWRYTGLYRDWRTPKWLTLLLGVQLFPTGVIFLGCLPLYPALALGEAGFRPLDAVALLVGLGATAIELIADEQMRGFARTRRPGELMDRGLWRLSRHPNYFGEICFWVSLWLFSLSADASWWWTAVGPVAMILMFVFASIPMLDRRSAERRPGFAAYAARTSALIPLPPRKER